MSERSSGPVTKERFRFGDLAPRNIAVGEALAAGIEARIDAGEWAPGSMLPPERRLAADFGVARSSVRQALHELALKGLVERQPGRGTVVLETGEVSSSLLATLARDDRDLLEVSDLRGVIEPQVAALAAARATAADVHTLLQICDSTDIHGTPEHSFERDLEFHRAIAHATHNSLLGAVVDITSEWLREVRIASHSTRKARQISLEGHRQLAAAIESGSPEDARTVMVAHLDAVCRLVDEQVVRP